MTNKELQKHIEDSLNKGLRDTSIPDYMHPAITDYVLRHRKPGDFLTAVLSNDLFKAVGQADNDNLVALHDWVILIYNFTPSNCWGSPERVKEWTAEVAGYIPSELSRKDYTDVCDDADRQSESNEDN